MTTVTPFFEFVLFLVVPGAFAIVLAAPVDRQNVMAERRRFPPPWTIEDNGACYIVNDRNAAGAR